MRIVEIISGLGRGGAEQALVTRLEHAPHGVQTHVLVTGSQDSHLVNRVRSAATLHRPVRAIGRWIEKLQPDLVITHNPRETLKLLAHPSLSHRYPVVVVAHNEITSEYRMKASFLDLALPLVNPRARMHISVSTRAAAGPQCLGGSDVRVSVLGSTFDKSRQPLLHFWPKKTNHRVLVLNRLSPQKNLPALIEATSLRQDLLRASNVHIVIAGDGELMKPLRNTVTEQGLVDLISLPGWIDDKDGLIAAAHTLLVSSSNEGGPLALYEALLAGIRVVSTPVGAAADVLLDDSRLRILPTATPQALADGLEQVVLESPLDGNEVEGRRSRYQWLQAKERASVFYDLCRQALS